MITFIVCLAILIAGYFIYGPIVEKIFGPSTDPTPALTQTDVSTLFR